MKGKVVLKQITPTSPLRGVLGKHETMCSIYWKEQEWAKNLNYFVDAHNNTVVEINALGPHTIHRVNLADGRNISDNTLHSVSVNKDDSQPSPSYYTMEEFDLTNFHNFYESPFTPTHGGACCVPIADPRRQVAPKVSI